MESVSSAWRPIDDDIKRDVSMHNPVCLSRLVLVRSGRHETIARWRHPFDCYDRPNDRVLHREGAWWSEQGKVLEFDPIEYREL